MQREQELTASLTHAGFPVSSGRLDPARLAEAAATHPDPWAQASAAEDLGVLHARRQDPGQAIRHLTQAIGGLFGKKKK